MSEKKTLSEVGECFGVTKWAVLKFIQKNGIKSAWEAGKSPKKNGREIVSFAAKNGLDKACRKFGKSEGAIKQLIANHKFYDKKTGKI